MKTAPPSDILDNPSLTQADLDRLPERVTRGPSHIWIEPTNRCNTRCTHCGHFYSDFGQDMDTDLYERIRVSVLGGVKTAELIGYGEPLMAKNFGEMFDECARRGIEIYTTTNGIMLRRDERVAKLVRSDLVLCLSIDGARAETFEFIRPLIKWEKMIQTLECIRRNAEEAGAERRFRLRFNFVAMKHNIADLPLLVRLAHRYGAEEIFVLPLGCEDLFDEVNGQSLHDSPELVSPAYLEALPLARQLGVHLCIPGSFRELILDGPERGRGLLGKVRHLRRRVRLSMCQANGRSVGDIWTRLRSGEPPRAKAGVTYCTMPWKDSYFASDGTVFPCCIMTEKLGDMTEQGWEEIWNGPAYRNLRRTVHSWNPSAVCRRCPLPTGINGGDERHHSKFFAGFRAEPLDLDDPQLEFQDGFHQLESENGGKPSHVWMSRRGNLSLPRRRGAKFLRLRITPRSPVPELNGGACRILGCEEEPFDNSCPEIHFPLDGVSGERLEVELEMETVHRVDGDDRDLALAIRGLQYLF